MVVRRRFLIVSVALAMASVTAVTCELIFHEGHVAGLRMDVCSRNYSAAGVFATALVVTTWKWFRAKPKTKSFITVKDLRH